MDNMDNLQPPGAMAADVEDEFFGPDVEDMGDYPPIAAPHQCSKGWDPSLLQNCTVARLRGIARNYDGVDANQNKVELFKAIFNRQPSEWLGPWSGRNLRQVHDLAFRQPARHLDPAGQHHL